MLIHIVDFQIKTSWSLITGIFVLLERSAFDLCIDYSIYVWIILAGMFFNFPRRIQNPISGTVKNK